MICNPVVVQQGGGSKVYSITDNVSDGLTVDLGLPESAEAGQIVKSIFYIKASVNGITDSAGNAIPFKEYNHGIERDMCFVMPASDVTIS